jgi:hypothetical protein
MDSHSCTNDHREGYKYDGKLILTEESRPAMVPYRTMLPQGVDNLLVPVCLSATHVAWGAIRLEPVWMQTGEAAGYAAALAAKADIPVAQLNPNVLVRTLVERRSMVAFFNDLDVTSNEPFVPAMQYLATKGFFSGYDAQPGKILNGTVAQRWAAIFKLLVEKQPLDATNEAMSVPQMEMPNDVPMSVEAFAAEFREVATPENVSGVVKRLKLDGAQPLTRGDACRIIYELLAER